MRSLLWLLVLGGLGLLLGPPLGLVVGYAIQGEDRLVWIGILMAIAALGALAGWIVWRADRRAADARRI